MKHFFFSLLSVSILLASHVGYSQLLISPNTVNYQVTYNPLTNRYTAFVIPNYNVPNANNPGSTERGSTAQYTLKVPAQFFIQDIQDIRGTWEKNPLKLGPGQPGQNYTGFNLDPAFNYYVIGKSSNESDYGPFQAGQPVALFSFRGNGCFGPINPLPPNDPFINAADQQYAFNVANSFYSRSGQPAGGNVVPLEQFVNITGPAADCRSVIANPESTTTISTIAVTTNVLANDTRNGQPASLTNVSAPVITQQPTNGTAVVNANGSITYRSNAGFTGNDSYIYRICYDTDPTLCDTALVRITVVPPPAPVARQDVVTGVLGQPTTINIFANDLGGNGQPASLTNVTTPLIVRLPSSGTAVINPDGSITYTPAFGFAGTDTLAYQICSTITTTICSTALVVVTIPSAPPTANRDNATTAFQQPVTIVILSNDTDRAGRPAALTNVTAPIIVGLPRNGTAVINSTGTLTYTPNAGFAGSDTLFYRICDRVNPLLCDSALVVINVGSAAPTANRDNYTTALNTAVQIPVLLNDVNRAGQPANTTNVTAPVVSTQPTNGSVIVNANGVITYTPNAGFAGTDQFIYRICDVVNTNLCDTALVVVNVTSAAPVANPDVATVTFNQPATVNVLANDQDRNGTIPATLTNVTTPTILAQPANGSAVVNANGSITFTPTPGFAGTTTLIYQICDRVNTALCDTALVRFNVGSAPPVANPDSYTLGFNQTLALAVLVNDLSRTGAPASVSGVANVTLPTIVTQPTGGTLLVNADGTITYNPNDTFTGNDSFVYQICDVVNTSLCDTALVRINVGNAPAPQPINDVVTGSFGQPVTVSLLNNDLAGNGQPANLTNVTAPTIVAQPNNGTAVINPDGTVTYTPAFGFAGNDTLTYQICSTISPSVCATAQVIFRVPSAPPTANRDNVTTLFQQPVTVPILLNDTDRAGRPASLTNVTAPIIVGPPSNGTAVVNSTGTITYTPNAGFAGNDTLFYRICDPVNTLLCDSALVVFNVGTVAPVANRDNYTTALNTAIQIPVLLNDQARGNQPASLTNVTLPVLVAQPGGGTVVVNADGTITYTPNFGFAGADQFIYRICDRVNTSLCDTALVVVNVGSAAPRANPDLVTTAFNTSLAINVLANDSDRNGTIPATLTTVTTPTILAQPTNGTAVVNANGTISFTPATGFAGLDTLVYQICDRVNTSLCDTARVVIRVGSRPAVANPDSYTLGFNQTLTLAVLANDQDRNGAPADLTNVTLPTIVTQPTGGTLVVNADGTITYDPNDTFTGNDAFIYRICDRVDPTQCDTAIVRITVGNAPAPQPINDVVTGSFGQPVTVSLLANDLAGNGQPANLTNVTAPVAVSGPSNGTAVINPDGTVTYTPAFGFAGNDTLTYQICSTISPNVCATAQVVFRVPSAPPTANLDVVSTAFQQAVTVPVLVNDTDRANRPANLTTVTLPIIVGPPGNGTAIVNSTGSITYTPNAGFAGSDTLFYRICDRVNPLLCDSALVVINVGSQAPVANRDNYTTALNTAVQIPVLLNDTDRGGPASLTNVTAPVLVSQPTNGSTVVNANGTITYTPNFGFAGADQFIYRICDRVNTSLCDTALVVVNVGSAAPRANPDLVTVNFNQPVTVNVLANDADRNGTVPATLATVTTPVILAQPANGTAVVNANGSISFTPAVGFAGSTTLVYQICDRVNTALCDTALVTFSVGSAPPVANPDSYTLGFNQTLALAVLANDLSRTGAPASLTGVANVTLPTIVTQPTGGTVVVNANGTITYDPNDTFTGSDAFIYRICDVVNTSLCDTAIVRINVGNAPAPTANTDVVVGSFGQTVTVSLLGNDLAGNGQPASLTNVTLPVLVSGPANGTATINPDGTLTFTPAVGFAGPDTLVYRICSVISPSVCDTARIIINVPSAPPTANLDIATTAFQQAVTIPILLNDTDRANRPASLTTVTLPIIVGPPGNGTARVNSTGSITYTPNAGFAGSDTLFYRICDRVNPLLCDSALVVVNVGSQAPVANRDNYTTALNTAIQIPVLLNDTDRGGPASLTNVTAPVLMSQPTNGSVVVNANGTITYTPNFGFAGADQFIYRICDRVNTSLCDTALVVVNVGSAAPRANPDLVTVNFNQPVTVNVLANDADRNGTVPATLATVTTPVILAQPANGTAVVNANGSISFTPAVGFAGSTTLVYQICDRVNTALCDTARVTFNVGSAPPVANPDSYTLGFNQTLALAVLANDLSRTGAPASLTGVANVTLPTITAQPANGTVVVNANGTITYDPNDTFTGSDAFIYRICDVVNTSLCDTAIVRINVGNAPAPTANTDVVVGSFGQTVTVSLLGNDLAGNGQPASLTNVTLPVVVSGPANGTATINPDGTLTFTPALGFAGPDTLVYRICSVISPSVCDTARIIINVPSAPPTANLDVATTAFQQAVTIPILLNDTDRANRPASLSTVTLPIIVGPPGNGTARVNSTGSITYTPNAGFAGSDTLFYRICDRVNTLLCDSALVVVNVGSQAPVANRDNYTTALNTAVQIPVLLNDTDRGGPASLTNVTAPVIVTQPTDGAVTVNANGTITYTPFNAFAGADQFIYRICDRVNQALCDTALVVVNVGSAAPRANPDLVTVNFNQPTTVNVLANDADRTGSIPASLTSVTAPVILVQPTSGTAAVNANGSITFTPATGFAGSTTLVYQICDRVNTALCDTARVTFNVGSAPPVANPDSYTLGFNQTLALAVLANDLSRTGAPASLTGVANVTLPTITAQPANGTVVVNANGTITYDPNDTFTGSDAFIYRICDVVNTSLCDTAIVRINVGNAPAPTANTDVVVGSFGQTVTVSLLGNDLAGNGQPASLTNVTLPVVVSGPANGTATINPDGTLTFTPALGFAGPDTLVYRICSVISPSVCDTARIIINVPSAPPTANLDVATTAFQQPVTIPILLNDTDRANRPASLSTVTLPIIVGPPGNGTARVNSTGSITYTPNAGFAGSDTLFYRICDRVNTLLCDSALVVVNVGSQAPVANRDNYTTALNMAVQIPVLLNDTDRGGPASLTNVTAPVLVSQPTNGSVVVNADGTITYTPNFGFAGADQFIYRICDRVNQALCDTALVVITTGSAAPRANPDLVTTTFNNPLTINVLNNDSDRNGTVPATLATVTVPIILSQPASGTAVVNANGTITFTPVTGFAGNDTLIYQICDRVNTSLCDTARVVIRVQSGPPVANPDSYTLGFNQTLALNVLANDLSRTGAPASLTNVTLPVVLSGPNNGVVTINPNGSITYNPNDTFTGNDQFVYQICDVVDPTRCDTALVRINVGNAPAPTATQDVVAGSFGQSITINLLGNDLAGNGQPANLTNVTAPVLISGPANGTATINPDGTLTFTPAPGFAGSDTLVYQICSTISPNVCSTARIIINVQSAPPTANLDIATTAFQQSVTIPILLNDTDRANRPASLTTVTLPIIVGPPSNGTARVNSTGSITYTPNAGFAGSDTLFYRICDRVNTLLCDSALVVVNVGSQAPVANRDNYTTALNTAIQIPVLLNDTDRGGPASLTNVTAPVLVSQPSNGSVVVNVDGTITYTPNFSFAGADQFIYRICDRVNQALCDTALVVVTTGSAAPRANPDVVAVTFNQPTTVNVLANDADRTGSIPASLSSVTAPVILAQPANGTAVVNPDGSITFTPAPGFAGSTLLVYQICDRVNTSLCDTARLTFNVGSAPPVANPDSYMLGFNQTLALNVLANDLSRTGAPASLTSVTVPTIVTQPTGGTVVVNANGTITYDPNDTFTGNDSFIYRICDVVNTSLCDTAIVRINVSNAPAPRATQDVVTGVFGEPLTVNALSNDLAGNGQPASLTNVTPPVVVSGPANGTAVVNPDGTVTYRPALGFAGSDTLVYRICSVISPNVCDTTRIIFNIPSAPPVANRDVVTTNFQQAVTIPVLLNDTDKAGRPANLTNVTAPIIVGPPSNGTAIVNSTGSITYTPNAGFAGSDTLFYRICDRVNPLLCDSALVIVNVGSTAPVANRDNYTTAFNQPVTVPILLNDTGRGGAPASLTGPPAANVTTPVIVDQFNNGTGVINANGTLTYTPNTGFAGSDTLIYRICDRVNQALCDTALVVIGVGSGAPRANPDIITTAFNTTITFGILANDQSRTGAPANLTGPPAANVTAPTILAQPTNGTATINANGTLSYRPATGFAGLDTLVYQICDVVNRSLCDTARVIISVQSAPPVANPDSYTLGFNQTLALNVLANDLSRTGAPASLTGPPAANITLPVVTFPPTNGTVVVNANGTITYDPNDTFTGNDAFIYRICDAVDPSKCDTAIVRINVSNAPAPRATQDVVAGALGQPVTVSVLLNDLAGNGQPANLTGPPAANVTPPVVVSGPANGTAIANPDGTITYTPAVGFAGSDTLVYRICSTISPSVCDTARIIINVPSAPPVANRDNATTTFQQEVTIPVLLNDTDRANRPASLTTVTLPLITQQPINGTARVNSTGSITYTPNPGFAGTDQLIYRICDQVNQTLCDTALVVINVGSAAPVANRDNYTTTLNTPVTVPILLNDLGRGGFPASLTGSPAATVTTPVIVDQFNNGTGVINANGTLTYTPNTGFAGADTLIYRICDQINTALCDTALVVINVGSAAPRANPDFASTGFQTPVTIPVLLNDQDRNNQPASTTNVTGPVVIRQPLNGTAIVTANGSIIYTPRTGFGGNDTLVYQICDRVNTSLCDTARVVISVAQGQVTLLAKAYLQGSLFGVFLPDTLMRDDLRVKGLLPTTSPYTPANGFTALTVTGTVNPSVFSVTGPNAIVDWVFVELRSPSDPTQVVDSRSALIQRDGDIVDLDGVSSVRFNSATAANYYVVVKHRNHLGAMTQTAIPLTTTGTVVDFRRASMPTFTFSNTALDQAQVVVEQGRALWAGNSLRENLPSIPHEFVTYQGTENDINVIYQQVINAPGNVFNTPFYKLRGYFTGDINMNGEVIFQGTGNDVEFIYQNVIKNHPGNTLVQPFFRIREQIP
ncbi:hypothetical protein GCM10023187_57080 [Nibrella viscosa]|uniref:Tandem-95 repeat protein n=1 Tax=Nibrella viscosa TaxID=1084524 RepID=A0ABP8L3A5_9BACT